mmetsp:Transcript_6467/g.9462  ORF Transcript_6467/g.9462 Transcript_6467/m.9462 type:complete len:231 (-) Transcript_6467:166-858(-)
MHEHILHPILQGDGTGGTTDTTSRQLYLDQSRVGVKVDVSNVSPILHDRGTYPGLQQLLNHGNDLIVIVQYGGIGDFGCGLKRGLAAGIMVHNGAENEGADVGPVGLCEFGNGDKVWTEIYALDAIDLEEDFGKGRSGYFLGFGFGDVESGEVGGVGGGRVAGGFGCEDRSTREKFYRFGIRGFRRLDEHGSSLLGLMVMVRHSGSPASLLHNAVSACACASTSHDGERS